MSVEARIAEAAATLRAGHDPFVLLERAEAASLLISVGINPAGAGGGGSLLPDLVEYARRYRREPLIRILLTFESVPPEADTTAHDEGAVFAVSGADAPLVPTLRILYPMLEHGTGRVLNGFPVVPGLLPQGCSPLFDALTAVQWVRDLLLCHGARVDLECSAFYNKQGFEAVRRKLFAAPSPSIGHPKPLQRRLCAYSSAFALEVMGLELPDGFDCGNKVLLSPVLLHQLAAGDAPAGRGAEGPLGHASASLLSDAGHGFEDEAALTFELVSPLGFPTYCGVAEFTCPHPDAVILPAAMMACLCVAEGTELAVRRVSLRPVESLVLQPHSLNFQAVRAFLGMAPRAFLERSLIRYATVQPGDVLACDGGPEVAARAARSAAGAAPPPAAVAGAASGRPAATTTRGGGGGDLAASSDYATDAQLAHLLSDAFGDEEAAAVAAAAAAPTTGGAGFGHLGSSSGDHDDDHEEGEGGAEGSPPGARPDMVFRFTVVSMKPADASACSLWAAYAGQVAIEFLPAADEFEVPSALPAAAPLAPQAAGLPAAATGGTAAAAERAATAFAAGGAAGDALPAGMLRPDMLAAVFGESMPAAAPAGTHRRDFGPVGSAVPPPSTAQASGSAAGGLAPPAAAAAGEGGEAELSADERRRRAAEAARRRFAAAPPADAAAPQ